MKYFNIASDFKNETIDKYAELNKKYKESKVIETYGQATIGSIIEGGRVYDDIPKIDLVSLKRYVEYSKSKGIDFNYSLNGSCMGNREFTARGVEEIKRMLYQIHEAGVRKLTVALPSMIELINETGLDFEIKVSIICQINNANKALAYKNMGVDRIVVDESVNRDFENLRRIRNAFGEKVEIIINSLCYRECIYRNFHYNQTSHDSVHKIENSVTSFYNHKCMLARAEKVSNMLKLCWVRPEDLKYYDEIGISYYKIQGRHTVVNGDPARAIECYFKESYDGNLIDLLELFNSPYNFKINIDNKKLNGFIKPYVENPSFCKRDCEQCNYCENFAKKCTDYNKAIEINELAKKFYTEFNQFGDLIKNTGINTSNDILATTPKAIDLDVDFDFNE